MSDRLVWLDLCSGLGGASQPALDRGWKVIRVDIDPRFKPDLLLDVADPDALRLIREHLHYAGAETPDVFWASPPCQEFSKFGLRWFFPNPPEPDLTLVQSVRSLIDKLKPRFWIVENVWSSRPWLTKIFGQVRAKPPGHALWSNLPLLLPNIEPHKGGRRAFAHLQPKTKIIVGKDGRRQVQKPAVACGPKRYDPTIAHYIQRDGPSSRGLIPHLRHEPANAAVIPYQIGEAICIAVENQRRARQPD